MRKRTSAEITKATMDAAESELKAAVALVAAAQARLEAAGFMGMDALCDAKALITESVESLLATKAAIA